MTLTDAEIKQRQQAARKHGVHAFEMRGEAALDRTGRSRLQELKEQVKDRDGVLELLEERAAHAVMLTELITSYISQQVKAGKSIDRIPIVRTLPAYMNTAQRALRDLINEMPDRSNVLDAAEVLEKITGGQKDN